MRMYNDIVPEFESLIDQISNSFFNYENKLFPAFAEQTQRVYNQLPWNGATRPCVHYGGDYIVTADEDNTTSYYLYFLIPGHDETSIEVLQKEGYLIIKTKDISPEDKSTSPFTKKVKLTHPDYEVREAISKNGILSIYIEDMSEEREKMKTTAIEVKSSKD
jgi:HSP20 family molecular chaperone IbpA